MTEKMNGKYRDYIIHPGEILKEKIINMNMNQEELAIRTGVTPKHVSEIINGIKGISSFYAKKLEYVFDGVSSQFWMNLESAYEQEILDYEECNNISSLEYDKFNELKDIYKYAVNLKFIKEEKEKAFMIIDFRKFLNISNLLDINKLKMKKTKYRKYDKLKINNSKLYAWIKLCEKIAEDKDINNKLDTFKLIDNLTSIKKVMFLPEKDIYNNLKSIFSDCGINFNIVKNFSNIPVQGFIERKDEHINLFMTLRGKFADIFWFTLFHEIGHILNNDFENYQIDLYDTESKEEDRANFFARTFLINDDDFNEFKNSKNISIKSIQEFANKHGVKDYIVIGRLQKELNDYTLYANNKSKYSWLDL